MPPTEILATCGISKLEAEPQEGPTEYKLHLLLKPRRKFTSTSTVQNVSGSHLSRSHISRLHSETDVNNEPSTSPVAPSNQSRQNRLQNLTTQLLWRLQQSSPYHSSSQSSLTLPILPEADFERIASKGPSSLIPGLEQSSGALYEIGVSDDGTFVGLAKDELEESLTVLRAMAFSLGCDIEVRRMIIVGDCQWIEEAHLKVNSVNTLRREKLWVAEVFVAPNLGIHNAQPGRTTISAYKKAPGIVHEGMRELGTQGETLKRDQLRVSLTGSTTSGKSSLLGTLSTSTLDNGRGKSRLSLLKHRHEIVTGVTSSLAQELLGYDHSALSTKPPYTKVINYASGNVSSWDDIHNASERNRLVFVTDSAGHPRYRRTTVRGLVSWAPHWTLCCVAADDQDDSSGKTGATASSSEVLGSAGDGVDLSKAHLDLCLKLSLPLVIVITKLDLATKSGLRDTLAKVLTTLKSAGRKPVLLPSSRYERNDTLSQFIAGEDEEAARKAIASAHEDELLVPIVLTSALHGSGIGQLHALLRQLPLGSRKIPSPEMPLQYADAPKTLFHIDEVFAIPSNSHTAYSTSSDPRTILSGYLRLGTIKVGDTLLIGPCHSDDINFGSSPDIKRARSYPGLSQEPPPALSLNLDSQKPFLGYLQNTEKLRSSPKSPQMWQQVRITSLRNLRFPVQRLSTDQVGTVGISLCNTLICGATTSSTSQICSRRGMVMLSNRSTDNSTPPSYNRLSAVFQEAGLPAWPGVLVIVYIASIRASAKILEVRALESEITLDEVFRFDDNLSEDNNTSSSERSTESPTVDQQTEITFQFTSTQEWIEIGTPVLVTPGGGPSLTGQPEQREIGSAGLEGYVGRIVQASFSH